jgi:hypothetical protein
VCNFASGRLVDGGPALRGRPVAANVEQAVHYYRSRRRLYPARALNAAAKSQALIENIDLDSADSPLQQSGLHHLNMTAHPAVQQFILQHILGIE